MVSRSDEKEGGEEKGEEGEGCRVEDAEEGDVHVAGCGWDWEGWWR